MMMMKVGEGKSGSVAGRANEFRVNITLRLLLLGEEEREEKSDYRSSRAKEGGRCTMCIRIDCDLYMCV